MSGYTMLGSDRKTNEEGGGVGIYIKKHFVIEKRRFSDGVVVPDIEYLCVVVKWKGQSLVLCVVYRLSYMRYNKSLI